MASWTFDEPWPNAAHGCIVDYYGRPKQAYYAVKAALAMVDVSLSYSDITASAGTSIPAMVFVDSNLAELLADVSVLIEYFSPYTITGAASTFAPSREYIAKNVSIGPSAVSRLGPVKFAPPASMVGNVVIARLSMVQGQKLWARHDYTFGITAAARNSGGGGGGGGSSTGAPLAALFSAPRVVLQLEKALSTAVKVTTAAGPGAACALFTKLTLRNASTHAMVPHAVFSTNYETIRPGEALVSELEEPKMPVGGGLVVCAEAWNAGEVCTSAGRG
eukprot:g93.t1